MNSHDNCTNKEPLAMATITKQQWCEPYDFTTALEEGTLFPCLNLTFFKAQANQCKLNPKDNSAPISQQNREQMLSCLDAISFALSDLTLYLDTHPDCPNGIALFHKLLKQRLELLSEFANKFYPLTQTSMVTGKYDTNMYGWPEGPMPWEGACI